MSIPEEDRWRERVRGMGVKRMGDYRIGSEGKWKGQMENCIIGLTQ